MRKQILISESTEDKMWNDIGKIAQEINDLTNFKKGNLSTPYSFVEEVIPKIEKEIANAKKIMKDYQKSTK